MKGFMNTLFRNLGSERALRIVGQSSDLILALFIIVIIMMIIIPLSPGCSTI